jgi:hypothetical protein
MKHAICCCYYFADRNFDMHSVVAAVVAVVYTMGLVVGKIAFHTAKSCCKLDPIEQLHLSDIVHNLLRASC